MEKEGRNVGALRIENFNHWWNRRSMSRQRTGLCNDLRTGRSTRQMTTRSSALYQTKHRELCLLRTWRTSVSAGEGRQKVYRTLLSWLSWIEILTWFCSLCIILHTFLSPSLYFLSWEEKFTISGFPILWSWNIINTLFCHVIRWWWYYYTNTKRDIPKILNIQSGAWSSHKAGWT